MCHLSISVHNRSQNGTASSPATAALLLMAGRKVSSFSRTRSISEATTFSLNQPPTTPSRQAQLRPLAPLQAPQAVSRCTWRWRVFTGRRAYRGTPWSRRCTAARRSFRRTCRRQGGPRRAAWSAGSSSGPAASSRCEPRPVAPGGAAGGAVGGVVPVVKAGPRQSGRPSTTCWLLVSPLHHRLPLGSVGGRPIC